MQRREIGCVAAATIMSHFFTSGLVEVVERKSSCVVHSHSLHDGASDTSHIACFGVRCLKTTGASLHTMPMIVIIEQRLGVRIT
jgi:hypothetical protein